MASDATAPQLSEYFLKPGYIYLPQAPTLISAVLGSCVAVCVWDRKREYGGMNHFLYPSTQNPREATARFGNVAVRALIDLVLEEGSRREDLEAQIFGGAYRRECSAEALEVSRQNVAVARRVLSKSNVSIVSEDVGGNMGRKLVFNTQANEVAIVRVDRLRDGDWYPYQGR